MTPEEKQRLDNIENKLNQLLDVFYKTNLPNNDIFEKKLTALDKIVAKKGIRFSSQNVEESLAPEIRGGTQINDAGIKAEVGYTSPNGSLYLSTSASQPFFVMVGTTWTLMNIP